jgi:hypothetical protein
LSKWQRSSTVIERPTPEPPHRLFPTVDDDEQRQALMAVREGERRRQREQLTLPQRLDRVLGALATVSTVPAGAIGRGRGGESERVGPPAAPQPEGVERELRIVRYAVEQLEAILDAERVGTALVAARMTGDEKDRVIWENFEGVHSAEVARVAPYLGGSARTIERARSREAKKRGLVCRLTTGEITGTTLSQAA